ncbi:MAG: ABC transporter [Legionellales bacterium]|jgi:ABC-2 type transport system ATP-binding protein|nr:ABC transporter [Legionellales bacterium]MBK69495.1 ABC transporter [Legionellales bacterium]|tara:strand:+ start:961 stop:1872 length:912 start_codon:yes stop_codon:yes gene_type:complete
MKALEINNLTKIYKNDVKALDNINLNVSQGDFFALLGPNGAGKSSTISIICDLSMKTSGSVKVFGHDIDEHSNAAKSCIGVVPQEINFSQFETCLEIVVNQGGFYGINRRLALERAEKYLKKLDLWTKRNERSRNLSGGMKRRLMIARALVHEPKMLILDEPTAGVDVELRRSMWDFLIDINKQGVTIVLTTHYLEEAESLCKNIAIIDHGKIVENTSMKILLSKLKKETFIFDLTHPTKKLPSMKNFKINSIDSTTIEVEVNRKNNINELFEIFNESGISVASMRNKRNRLEELFINLLNEK